MAPSHQQVPYGYEPPPSHMRGTLIYYDDFNDSTDAELEQAVVIAEHMRFAKLVLYPLHEQTVRRMSNEQVAPFYKREQRLQEWKLDSGHKSVIIEGWDGKRKKYTPIEAALRTLIDHYSSPYFLLMTPEMANRFASFSTFEEWITKISLVLTHQPDHLHPRMDKFRSRWRVAGEERSQTDKQPK
ncbi:hypothetical protein [Paenibacillus kandeliae]|uniref:hypothetical protein n=1 Tax=Paenibacillus kandeliae TaxID=3231269 RepID=UPI003459EB85